MGNFRSSPRGAPRDASVAGTPLRGPRFLALERIPLEFAPVSPLSFRGPSVARGPESIITACGYGFRARAFGAPRNDRG